MRDEYNKVKFKEQQKEAELERLKVQLVAKSSQDSSAAGRRSATQLHLKHMQELIDIAEFDREVHVHMLQRTR